MTATPDPAKLSPTSGWLPPAAQAARNGLFDTANELRLAGGVVAYWADVIEEIADGLFPTVIFGLPVIPFPDVSSMTPRATVLVDADGGHTPVTRVPLRDDYSAEPNGASL